MTQRTKWSIFTRHLWTSRETTNHGQRAVLLSNHTQQGILLMEHWSIIILGSPPEMKCDTSKYWMGEVKIECWLCEAEPWRTPQCFNMGPSVYLEQSGDSTGQTNKQTVRCWGTALSVPTLLRFWLPQTCLSWLPCTSKNNVSRCGCEVQNNPNMLFLPWNVQWLHLDLRWFVVLQKIAGMTQTQHTY